jgi:hypothetical protein
MSLYKKNSHFLNGDVCLPESTETWHSAPVGSLKNPWKPWHLVVPKPSARVKRCGEKEWLPKFQSYKCPPKSQYKVVPPLVLNGISPINPSYSSYLHQLSYLGGTTLYR